MPGPGDNSASGAIIDFFAGGQNEPVTAQEIATETQYASENVRMELEMLVDRGVLRTKELGEGTQVWWSAHGVYGAKSYEPASPATDGSDTEETRPSHKRLVDQHRQLSQFVTRIDITDDLDEILRQITEEARELVGAHQSVTSRTINQNWAQAINEVSLSEKYADYRDYDTEPDGSGIYALICERNQPMRMTQAELESHPAWQAFDDEADDHPPMDGWLAVPIVGSEDENMGIIQLSDKYQGEFTAEDQAIIIQLANIAAAAIENARLYVQLRESEERYRTLFESMTEGYCVIERVQTSPEDPGNFHFVEANPAYKEVVGTDDIEGETIQEAVPGEPDAWLDVYDEVARTGAVVEFDHEIESRGRVLRCQGFPVGDPAAEQVGVTVQDITERVEHERRLTESNERLEQFAYAASHDLQEPLRMVSSYLQLIDRRYDDLDDDVREYLEYAVDGADRMREMIEGLLEYSRVEKQSQPLEPTDLNAALADVREDLHLQIEESDAVITSESLPTVKGDPGQLRQLFQNLVDNAIEYSGEESPRIEVTADRVGEMWMVSVADEGIGIEPDQQERIFRVFGRLHSREDHPGTGIGLALCERIVERHGGDIWVDSESGEGSTFSFTLPAVDA